MVSSLTAREARAPPALPATVLRVRISAVPRGRVLGTVVALASRVIALGTRPDGACGLMLTTGLLFIAVRPANNVGALSCTWSIVL